ncbi:MAG: flagellar basal body P-ring formation chaperone FlgA [Bryobacteraceae bacterium]|nr:flagellar basal body P-ring formation chaperone FlgA [Bryobacteraceae bacterium]
MWLVSVLALAFSPECLTLRDDAITAADLARVAPEFAQLPPATPVAWAPAPGVRRSITPGELVRLGRVQGLTVAAVGVCLERAVVRLEKVQILAALRASEPEAQLEVLAFGPLEAPPGRLEFTRRGLPAMPRRAEALAPVTWRGQLKTASGRAFPVWARVRVKKTRRGLVAARDLAAGEVLAEGSFAEAELADYPGWAAPLTEASLVLGQRARRAIPARAPLLAAMLTARREVERGDSVVVALADTDATLTAQAESPGRKGETVLLRNPLNGRRFASRVTGPGQAALVPQKEAAHGARP